MRKKTIALFYIIGIVLFIIGLVVAGIGAASSVNVAADGTVTSTGAVSPLALVGAAIYVIGGILTAVSWIGALIATGKLGRWGWFVCLILFSGITILIYLIAGPSVDTYVAPTVTY
mgnify:CR=1 FL=1